MDCHYSFSFQEAYPPPLSNRPRSNHRSASHTRRTSNASHLQMDQGHPRTLPKVPPQVHDPVSLPGPPRPTFCTLVTKSIRRFLIHPNKSERAQLKRNKQIIIKELRELRKEVAHGTLTPARAVYLRHCIEDMRDILSGNWDEESD
jgi:hypothetical protein